ncbi:MAG TPA: hypothetical protein ENL12_01515, partial [Dehalococcoidia bacterium]|nr:hypothetical protein [Dehalococcoidia bacterium]
MRLLARLELKNLIDRPGDVGVSIYLPTQRTGDVEQGAIRLRNLVRQASDKLEAAGMRSPEVARILEPARALVEDPLFWHKQADGLALFLSKDQFVYYRLPYTFAERVVVSSLFHVSPLIPLFSASGMYYVLALSQNHVRLIQCTRDAAWEVTPDSVPERLADALQYDDFSKELQFRSAPAASPAGKSAMYHGHGEGKDVAKDNILRFLRVVDSGIKEALNNAGAPLVLAGVEYMRALYREVNSYPHLVEDGVEGNADELSAADLQRAAWGKVEPYFTRAHDMAVRRYGEGIPLGLTRNVVDQVVLAAADGRVSVLFASMGAQVWGRFSPEDRRVEVHREYRQGDEVLVDVAVVRALVTGADTY